MDKAKKFFSLFLVVLFSSSLMGKDISKELDHDIKLSVSGVKHNLSLKENRQLLDRVQSSKSSLTEQGFAKHYSGKLEGHDNSWYRISRINQHWTGIVSLEKHTYVIDEYVASSTLNDSIESGVLHKGLTALSVAESIQGESLHCGVASHNHAEKKSQASSADAIYSQLTNKTLRTKNTSLQSVQNKSAVAQSNISLADICTDFADGVCLIAEVEFVFDTEYQDAFSSAAEAQQEALALINMVEGFYFNDFEVKFDTLTLEFLTSNVFSTTLDSSDLLDDMRDKKRSGSLGFVKNPQALLHLVTGRDFNGTTVGTAFVDVLCNSRGASTGNSQLLRRNGNPNTAVTSLIVAHEMGHNFGASHDGSGNLCSGAFIMAPSVNSSSTGFSNCSIDVISADISSISDKSACFNFPTDLSITANSSNPSNVAVGESILTDYSIAIDDSSFEQVSSINVNGSLPNGSGVFQSASVNGVACSITNSNQEYSCNLSALTAPINLNVTSLVNANNFMQTHSVSVGDSAEIIDVNQSNDSVQSTFAISVVSSPTAASNALAQLDSSAPSPVVNISWQDNSDNEDGFIIERSVNSGNFSELTQVGINATSFLDSAVNAGESYDYRIIAFNVGGSSAASNTSTITLGIEPNAVSNLSASINTAGTSVDLAWQDNSDNEDEFIIERSVDSGAFSQLATVAANVTSFSDSDINASTTYAYRVTASNSTGAASVSNEVSVTTAAAPTPPAPTPTPPADNSGGGGGGMSIIMLSIFLWMILVKQSRFKTIYSQSSLIRHDNA